MGSGSDPLGWVGAVIDDRFAVEHVVGEGGFGIVYRGTHRGLDEPVAIKCLKVPAALRTEDRDKLMEDFRREAKLLHRLSRKSNAIVQALDFGAAISPRGVWAPYIVMEWLEGRGLDSDLEGRELDGRQRRPLVEVVTLLAPVAQALAVAHAEGVAHLDVKPANIFLCSDGAIKLLDFGIAKVLTGNEGLTNAITQADALNAFTPSYGAPEQFNRRHGRTGPRTDVFALALVLIETCSAEAALLGDTPLQFYVASANEQYRPSLEAHGVRVGQRVDEVVKKALEVEPSRRFPSAGAMWQALEEAMAAPSLLGPTARSNAPVSVSIVPSTPAARSSGMARTESAPASSAVPAATGINRVCTVVVAELTGTETAAEHLDPEELSEVVDRCVEAMRRSVESLGGSIERLVGDGLMAVFGLYLDSASAAERAVLAALRMGLEVVQHGPPQKLAGRLRLGVRAGVATGRVFVTATHATAGFKLMATGAPVKAATALQQLADTAAIVIDRDTYRQVSGIFDVEVIGGVRASGKAYRITRLARDRHALAVEEARRFYGIETKLVGRTAEIGALGSLVEAVASEPCSRFVTMIGAPGVGKTRLLVELADDLRQKEWFLFAAQCSQLHVNTGYALAASLIRARFHIHEDDDRATIASKLLRGLRALANASTASMDLGSLPFQAGGDDEWVDADELVEQVVRLLGASDEPAPSADDERPNAKHRIASAVASMLRMADGPVAVVCDDIQWADEASLGLLEDVCLRLADKPVLVACATRNELIDRKPLWGEGVEWHKRVALGALSRKNLEEMTRDRLRRVPELGDEFVRRLAEHADGNPMALVETLHLLIDVGAIDTEAEPWRVHEHRAKELALPTTVHGVVQARLDQLDEESRLLLARAAVVGSPFWDSVLLRLDPEAGAEQALERLGRQLGELRERGLVRARAGSTFPDEREFVFGEAVTQRVAYEMLGAKERRRLHRIVADWLAERTKSDAGAGLIATHYERAAALPEALAAYQRAAAHAAALGHNTEALHAYGRACSIDDWICGGEEAGETTTEMYVGWEPSEDGRVMGWPERVALRTAMGDVLRRMGEFDAAQERYREARARVVPVERREEAGIDPLEVPRWQARLDYRQALVDRTRGAIDAAQTHVDLAIEHGTTAELDVELAEMWSLAASTFRRKGELDACKRACLRGLSVCRRTKRRDERWRQAVSKLLNALGSMFFAKGRHPRAERCYLEAARVIDDKINPEQASRALNNVAAVRYARGDLDGARASFERVVRLTERSGDLWVKLTALGNLGEVLLALGRSKQALELLQQATRLTEQTKSFSDAPEYYRNLARAAHELERPAEALEAIARALALLDEGGGNTYAAGVLGTAAKLCTELAAHGMVVAPRVRLLAIDALRALDRYAAAVPYEQAAAIRRLVTPP